MRGEAKVVRVVDRFCENSVRANTRVKDIEIPKRRKISTNIMDYSTVHCFSCGKRTSWKKRRASMRWAEYVWKDVRDAENYDEFIVCKTCYELEAAKKKQIEAERKSKYLKDLEEKAKMIPSMKARPFCGGSASLHIEPTNNGKHAHYMECDICGARGCATFEAMDAREVWNKRTGE